MNILVFLLSGVCSWYSLPGFTMADGKPFDPSAHVCAMLYEPFGERVELFNEDNHRGSWCIVEDRGPFEPGRIIDVSPAVRDDLGMAGLANVVVYRISGQIPTCKREPPPSTCKSPPSSCVLDLPKPALVTCNDRGDSL